MSAGHGARGSGYPWQYSLFIMTYYITHAVYQGFISKYYAFIGMDQQQLSWLMAATPFVAIFMQPAWGILGDRAASRNRILRAMTAISIVFVLLYNMSGAYLWLLSVSCLFAACYTAIQPMGDSIVLESLVKKERPFGPLRLTGCLSYAVFNIAVGYVLEGRFRWVPYMTAGLLFILLFASHSLPPAAGHQQASGRRMNIVSLAGQPGLMGLLTLLMLLQLTMGYFYAFFPIYFTSEAHINGSSGLLGICFFISAVSEVPFLLYADRLFGRYGAGRLMCVSALVCTVRWVILAVTGNMYIALFSQALHGWGFIVMTVSMAKYVSATVPPELRASGQMLIAVVGFGIARVFGILGGGLLSDALGGIRQGFWLMAIISGAALIVFSPMYMRRAPMNGNDR